MPIRVASRIYRNRHGIFYFRIVIPSQLRSVANRSELRFSLHTEQRELAIDLALPLISAIPLLMADLHNMAVNDEAPPADYFAKWRSELLQGAVKKARISLLQHEVTELRAQIERMVPRQHVQQVAIRMHERGQLEGKKELERALVFPPPPEESPLFSALQEAYLASLLRRPKGGVKKPPTEKTLEAYRAEIGFFITVMEDVHIGAIDREVAGEYFGILKQLPANLSRKAEYRGKSIQELLDLKAPPQTEANASKKMERISSMFEWALEEKRKWGIDSNPFKGFGQQDTGDEKRRPFTVDELRVLLSHPDFLKKKFKSSYSFWLIPLALFTGARLGELCQLELGDFVEVDGIPCIDINDKASNTEGESGNRKKRVKTPSAKRLVPIHPELIRIGLLRHVEKQRLAGETNLFPELNLERRDGPGHAPSNWFQRYRAKVGITGKQQTVFHSFRHLFITKIMDAGITPHLLAPIVGHEADLVTGKVYWNKRDASMRKPTVDAFNLPKEVIAMLPTVEEVKFTDAPGRKPSHKGPCAA
ncbi:site-specific integrase [Aquabacterium sp.]|uniref:site-specific integrase n=1 Tax=Aquabacterium sp. TaxID=1872578 RepID=UPI00248A2084|nr:site-specific integrase [Aquabacterium sp.]MDI1259369.1 site-specific integrase [Aquabacterium sp.]